MKNLYIIRHSKAVEYASDQTDFSRCLANYGIEKATLIAEHLAQELQQIDLILTSPACRAKETASIFARALNYPDSRIVQQEPLYHFGGIDWALKIISEVDDTVGTLMLVGHNPTFNALAWHLCDEFREGLPTSAVVGIHLNIRTWAKIYKSKGRLHSYLTKRKLD